MAVRDLKGLHYLARLLADPGREFHVLDLVATGIDPAASIAVTTDPELTPSDWGIRVRCSTPAPRAPTAAGSWRSRKTSTTRG